VALVGSQPVTIGSARILFVRVEPEAGHFWLIGTIHGGRPDLREQVELRFSGMAIAKSDQYTFESPAASGEVALRFTGQLPAGAAQTGKLELCAKSGCVVIRR
jgi:hypothetical protein